METIRNRKHIQSNTNKKEVSSKNLDENTSTHLLNEETLRESSILESFNESYSSLNVEKSSYHLTRIVLLRFLAFIYGLYFLNISHFKTDFKNIL
jgi:hypothetical protein